MKVVIVKEAPNAHLNNFINEVSKQYSGNIIKLNCINKVHEIKNMLNIKNRELLSEIKNISDNLSDTIFNDTINLLESKKANELIFIYITNENHIKILQEKYQTITVNKDFIFDLIESKNNSVQNFLNNLN